MQNLSAHSKNWTLYNWVTSESQSTSSTRWKRNRQCSSCRCLPAMANKSSDWQQLLLLTFVLLLCSAHANADEDSPVPLKSKHALSKSTTTPLTPPGSSIDAVTETEVEPESESTTSAPEKEDWQPILNATQATPARHRFNGSDSIFLRFARSFSSGNELWDGIIRDCYKRPDMSCFQKNIYSYLDGALSQQDVNITQRFKFYKNQVLYEPEKEKEKLHNEARSCKSEF